MQNSELQNLLAEIQAFLQMESPEEETPILQQHPELLKNVGTGQRNRYYIRSDEVPNFKKELEACQKKLQETPHDSPDLLIGITLNWLGLGLCRLGKVAEGIEKFRQAVQVTKKNLPNHPNLSMYLCNLGHALKEHYKVSHHNKDFEDGIAAFKEGIKVGLETNFSDGLVCAGNWLRWSFERDDWKEVTEVYQWVKSASTNLLKLPLVRGHQEAFLHKIQGLPAKVAYAYIQMQQFQQAVEALEENVARLLSEALQLSRADLTEVQRLAPELYTAYKNALEACQNAQMLYDQALPKRQIETCTQEAKRQILNNLIAQIRETPGLENFLPPSNWLTVQAVSATTPVVYLFYTEKGGYALIIWQGDIQAVPLPELTYEALIREGKIYFNAYNYRRENEKNWLTWFTAIDDLGQWLWKVLWQPLCEELTNQQRITFIPVGWLNLLPLHAAWTADPTGRRYYALDKVTIAYAPNAVSLQKARDLATHIPADKLLAIDEPKPVKADPLPNSSVEVNAIIARHFTQTQLLATAHLLRHETATQDTVKDALKLNYNVLHFSCHGGANFENPLETGLVMANDQMLTVQHFLDAKLQARLATLSACETGMIGMKNIEEVVGLPASLLQAGVAGVVASLWSVNDFSTALLMIKFYECFFQNPSDSDTAVALRTAQRWLRDATQQELLDWAKSTLSGNDLKEVENTLNWFNNSDVKPYEHPYYWAAFCAVGQ